MRCTKPSPTNATHFSVASHKTTIGTTMADLLELADWRARVE
jgi:hypothetical protein